MNEELDGGIPLPQAFRETKAGRSLSLRPICRIREPKEDSHKWASSKKDSKVLLDRRSDLSQAGTSPTLTCAYSLSIAAFF